MQICLFISMHIIYNTSWHKKHHCSLQLENHVWTFISCVQTLLKFWMCILHQALNLYVSLLIAEKAQLTWNVSMYNMFKTTWDGMLLSLPALEGLLGTCRAWCSGNPCSLQWLYDKLINICECSMSRSHYVHWPDKMSVPIICNVVQAPQLHIATNKGNRL